MDRGDEIRDVVMHAIGNDYEDFEEVVKLARRWATEDGRELPSAPEIAAGLTALIEAGLAKAYLLYTRQTDWAQEVPEAEWRAALLRPEIDEDMPYYFYVTPEGKRALTEEMEKDGSA